MSPVSDGDLTNGRKGVELLGWLVVSQPRLLLERLYEEGSEVLDDWMRPVRGAG